MTLTTELLQAAEKGPVTVKAGGREYVVLSREIYDQVKQVRDYDDSEMNPRAAYPAVLKAWDAQGAPEDATDYEDLA